MRITAFAIGTRMPGWVQQGVGEYQKRLPRHLDLEFREIAAARGNAAGTSNRDKEGERLLKALPERSHVVALDEHGSAWTSTELAGQLESWQGKAQAVSLLIGGADGLSPACKERAQQTWSLSPLTLPHALVRVVLAEQIYRAWTLLQGHPYHRA